MYKNPGKKIRALAKIFCIIGIIGSVIVGVLIITGGALFTNSMGLSGGLSSGLSSTATGILVIIGGSLIAWINSIVLYAFGDMADNLASMKSDIERSTHGM